MNTKLCGVATLMLWMIPALRSMEAENSKYAVPFHTVEIAQAISFFCKKEYLCTLDICSLALDEYTRTAFVVSEKPSADTVYVMDIFQGKLLYTIPPSNTSDVVIRVASSKGKIALLLYFDGTVKVWNGEEKAFMRDLVTQKSIEKLRRNRAFNVALSKDGKRALVEDVKGIVLYDTKNTLALRTVSCSGSNAALAFKNDLSITFSGTIDGGVYIVNLSKGELIKEFKAHANPISAVALSQREDAIVATASIGELVRLWNAEDGSCIREFMAPGAFSITSLAFSNDGRFTLAGGINGLVYLWDTATGELLEILKKHTKYVVFVGFNAEDTEITTISGDGRVVFWKLTI